MEIKVKKLEEGYWTFILGPTGSQTESRRLKYDASAGDVKNAFHYDMKNYDPVVERKNLDANGDLIADDDTTTEVKGY